ncbi:hypothetical protein [Synechococcus sp. RedBA-s]|uniref:hypothetical protein n=1 Tax=Synechococcus sp. RedBA-s TaxID=2823741 RepID=UPI0020CD756C|nr:hypothetical protein [Synechococcus sp. RedBA-s]MCP9801162.1 hypothetical protein [Synechococcus sp. RedBA-s]
MGKGWGTAKGLMLGLTAAATLLAPTAHTAPYCLAEQRFFSQGPQPPDASVERVNGLNIQNCSSGQPCLNQLFAGMVGLEPLPAAYEWKKIGRRLCIEPRDLKASPAAAR